jgi:alkylhydroperoxidase family enzyme
MAYIDKIPPERADGVLAREYDKARRRAGRIWEIVAVQCQNPEALRDSIRLYQTVMFGPSPLSRAHREMLAVVVSRAHHCHY